MNFQDKPNWDNNTYGMSAKGDFAGVTLYGEAAYQDKAGIAANKDAWYSHFNATKGFGKQSLTVGIESLGAGFKTPLATNHAFNGFSDALLGGRSEGSQNGLTDCYLTYTVSIFYGIKWISALHAFGDNDLSAGYGWEYDSVLVKKFDDNFSALAKFAYFDTNNDPYVGGSAGPALPETTRFSVEIDYTF